MTIVEIIFAILLILSCVFIIAVVLMQESKQGMSNVITGGSSDNYFQKNSGRTKEAKLARATKTAAVLVFVLAIAVNLITVYFGGKAGDDITGSVTDEVIENMTSDSDVDIADDTDDTNDAETETPADSTADEAPAESAAE